MQMLYCRKNTYQVNEMHFLMFLTKLNWRLRRSKWDCMQSLHRLQSV